MASVKEHFDSGGASRKARFGKTVALSQVSNLVHFCEPNTSSSACTPLSGADGVGALTLSNRIFFEAQPDNAPANASMLNRHMSTFIFLP
jgi:hypothetical protein